MDPVYHGARYMDPEFRWNQNGYGRNEYPHPHPQDIHEAIQREIEKERIREEIIMSEIVRRRVLEAEVRRELMMEREMALLQGRNGFPFGSSPVMGLESPMRPSLLVTKEEGWPAEERLRTALEDKEKLKRSENGGLETLSFQRGTADLRISEIKLASEGDREKERILLPTKPDENVSGSKTEDVTPPEVVNIELLADVIANKISKEEWSCALCEIMATSEKELNKHVLGKKHMLKVAALRAQRAGKNYSIGLFPKKPTESIHMEEKGVKLKAHSLFSQKEGNATSKKDDLPLSQNPKSEHLLKTQAEMIQKAHKNENDPRKKDCKFSEVMNAHELGNIELLADVVANKKSDEEWMCALCQVIATSEKGLNEHVLGKKHKSKVAALNAQRTGENRSIGLFPEKPTESINVEEKGVKHKAQSLFSQEEGKATSKKDDLPLSQNPKSEHLTKTQAEVIQKVQKNENDPRKKDCEFSEVMNAYELGNIELLADVIANKKSNEEWMCALCQVIATSEKGLNEHVLGKKHKSKVAALNAQRTGENRSIGLSPEKPTESINVEEKGVKPTESIHVEEKGVKLKAQSFFSQNEGKATSKKDDLPLSQNPKSEHLTKTQAEVIQKVQKNENDPRKKDCKFGEVMNAHELGNIELLADIANKKSNEEWRCALCQVIATSEKGLNEHVLGKKHKSKVAALNAQGTGENRSIRFFPEKPTESINVEEKGVKPTESIHVEEKGMKPTESIHVEEKGMKLKAQSLFSQKEGNATSKKDDLPLAQNPKSEHLTKTQAEVIQKVQKNENDPRKKDCKFSEVMNTHESNENDPMKKSCKFSEVMNAHELKNIERPADVNANKKSNEEWRCALCQVSATSENGLNEHMRGKKHKLKEGALRNSQDRKKLLHPTFSQESYQVN